MQFEDSKVEETKDDDAIENNAEQIQEPVEAVAEPIDTRE